MDSSFIERFGIWGMAGMLGLMAVMGVYGFVSLVGVDPQEALLPPAEEVVSSEPERRVPDDPVRLRPTPAVLAETAPPTATADAGAAPPPVPSPTPRAAVRADAPAPVRAAAPAPPAGAATPASSPAGVAVPPPPPTAPPATPGPTPPPETPAPTPEPPVCSPGAPELSEHGNQVRFSNGSVVWFEGSVPGALAVDVGGTVLPLLVTEFTDVSGPLASATVLSGQAHRADGGVLVAQSLQVICPL